MRQGDGRQKLGMEGRPFAAVGVIRFEGGGGGRILTHRVNPRADLLHNSEIGVELFFDQLFRRQFAAMGFALFEIGDPAGEMYAKMTKRACERNGVTFELRRPERVDLEAAVIDANADPAVHGILIYYPVFGAALDSLALSAGGDEAEEALATLLESALETLQAVLMRTPRKQRGAVKAQCERTAWTCREAVQSCAGAPLRRPRCTFRQLATQILSLIHI